MLKTISESQKSKWRDNFPKSVFAYNITTNKSTGYSHFLLMFRKSSKLPIDSIFNVNKYIINQKSIVHFSSDWKNQINTAIKIT